MNSRHPDDLYKNGIQRSSFIPAIDLLKTHFEVTDLDSGTDYRRIPRALSNVYFHPLNEENKLEIGKLFQTLTSGDEIVENRKLDIWGRQLNVPESSKNTRIARFQFNDLCGKPLSAADYIEVTKEFSTIFLLDVPSMGMDSKDKVRLRAKPDQLLLLIVLNRQGDLSRLSMRAMRARRSYLLPPKYR